MVIKFLFKCQLMLVGPCMYTTVLPVTHRNLGPVFMDFVMNFSLAGLSHKNVLGLRLLDLTVPIIF